jgi:hypothetical protein
MARSNCVATNPGRLKKAARIAGCSPAQPTTPGKWPGRFDEPIAWRRDTAFRGTGHRSMTSQETFAPAPAEAKAQPPKAPPAVTTAFERFEIKFWVPEYVAQEITRFAAPYMKIDAFSVPGIGQHNTSMYLDTPDLLFARLHLAKSPDRFKLRVRRYGDPPDGPGFFEIKRKMKTIIFKRRAVVPWHAARALLVGDFDALSCVTNPAEKKSLEAFLHLMTLHGAEPKVIVQSHREAYAANDPLEDVRLTFDRQIVYQPVHGSDFQPSNRGWIPIDRFVEHGQHGRRVMTELKFRSVAPWWMSELVHRLDLWRVGYSKYIAAILRECRDFGGMAGWPARRS